MADFIELQSLREKEEGREEVDPVGSDAGDGADRRRARPSIEHRQRRSGSQFVGRRRRKCSGDHHGPFRFRSARGGRPFSQLGTEGILPYS